MTEFTLQHASEEDSRTLAHIGAATFLESYTELIDGTAIIQHCQTQHSASTYADYISRPKTRAWIAKHATTGAPLGYALNCEPELEEVEPCALDIELKRIYVLSRFHGCGAGKALMKASIQHAQENRASRLLLGTYEGNERAIRFYKKSGFEKIGTRRFLVGGIYFDDVVMGKSL